MPDLDPTEIARDLAKTSANLKRHIADEAQKRAAKLGVQYAKAADERIKESAAELQRAQDLVRELKRQMKPLTRHTYAHCALEKRLHELIAWAKEHEGGVPAEALFTAIGDARETAQARWEREQAAAQQSEAAGS